MLPDGHDQIGMIIAHFCCSCVRMLASAAPRVPCWSAPQVTAVSCGSSHSLAILSGLLPRLLSMHPGVLLRGLMYDQCAKTPPYIAGVHPPESCMPFAQLASWLMECSSCTGCDLLIAWGRGEDGQLGDHLPSHLLQTCCCQKEASASSQLCMH